MSKSCETCKHKELHGYQRPCNKCHEQSNWSEVKEVSFQRLNGLKPTLQSCILKVYEEYGELARELGKGQGASGEQADNDHAEWAYRTIGEALDSMQSLNTLINLLADENNIDIHGEVERHEQKLREKGYLV